MPRTMNQYTHYSFKDQDPIVDYIRTIIADEKASYANISAESRVSISTLRSWFNGKTKRPQHATVMGVVRSLGYDMVLTKSNKVVHLSKFKRTRKVA